MNFFPRQTLIGNLAAPGEYYSDVFDASMIQMQNLELRLYVEATGSTAITASLEHNDDPTFKTAWGFVSNSVVQQTGVGIVTGSGVTTPTKRFLRAKLSIPSATVVVVHFNSRGFC